MPRIYVASLKDHNAGIHYGQWIDLDEVDEITEGYDLEEIIFEMLAGSPTAELEETEAEDWEIHDHEGWGSIRPGEMDLEALVETATLISEKGLSAVEGYINMVGEHHASIDEFDQVYRGQWKDEKEFAKQMAEDLILPYIENQAAAAGKYFDYEQYAEDLFEDAFFSHEANGKIHVYEKA